MSGKYYCVVNAFSRVLKMTPDELVGYLPHDGLNGRTHHIQEIIDVAANKGCWFCPIELVPQTRYDDEIKPVLFGDDLLNNFNRFKSYLSESEGVLVGMRNSVGHAVYFNGKCHDDKGSWNLWDNDTGFLVSTYWRAVWLT